MPTLPRSYRPAGMPSRKQQRKAQDERRGSATERGYDSRWRRAREQHLREHPLCVMCQADGKTRAATVVDHIEPPRLREAMVSGDRDRIARAQARFWDRRNWQSLCAPHHSRDKQRVEAAAGSAGGRGRS